MGLTTPAFLSPRAELPAGIQLDHTIDLRVRSQCRGGNQIFISIGLKYELIIFNFVNGIFRNTIWAAEVVTSLCGSVAVSAVYVTEKVCWFGYRLVCHPRRTAFLTPSQDQDSAIPPLMDYELS